MVDEFILLDRLGKSVLHLYPKTETAEINLSGFPGGIYVLMVYTDNQKTVSYQKLVT